MRTKARAGEDVIGAEMEDRFVQTPFPLLLRVSSFRQEITHVTYPANFEVPLRYKLPRVL